MRLNPATPPATPPAGPDDLIDPAFAAALDTVTDDHVVALLVPDPLSPYEFSIACEVFGIRRADVLASMTEPRWYRLVVCSEEPGRDIATPMGFSIRAGAGLDQLVEADTVIVPMSPRTRDCEVQRIGWRQPPRQSDRVLEAVAEAAARGARVASFCTGAFTLAEAGLLDGRRATTHWMYAEAFAHRYPRVEFVHDVLYVDEGDVLTSAGSASATDLSLHLVRRDHGADVADIVARRMVVPPHRDGGQAQYTRVPSVPTGGRPFAELLDWITRHLDEPLQVNELAERAAMSERTFARRFREATGTTPLAWITQQRVTRARQLLETTDLTVDVVAARSGLGSATNLRYHLREACGVAPSTYRQRFRRGNAA